MSNAFKDFMAEKERALEEIEANKMDYDTECRVFGTRAASTRQPPAYHAMIHVMNKYIPLTSKAEILNVALSSAFSSFIQDCNESVRDQILNDYAEEVELVIGLISPLEGTTKGGISVTPEMKDRCLKIQEERGEDK